MKKESLKTYKSAKYTIAPINIITDVCIIVGVKMFPNLINKISIITPEIKYFHAEPNTSLIENSFLTIYSWTNAITVSAITEDIVAPVDS